jgi:hypothetical protein
MTALELFAILVLAGAVIVLLYYYLQDSRKVSVSRLTSSVSGTGDKTSGVGETVSGVGDKLKGASAKVTETVTGTGTGDKGSGVGETVSGVGDKLKGASAKITETISGKTDKTGEGGTISGMGEKMAGMGEKIKGRVSTDSLSHKIDLFLDDKSDQLIKDWKLATKSDLSGLEKRYNKVSRDVGELESRFNEYRGYTNKKITGIEERLSKLENPGEKQKK